MHRDKRTVPQDEIHMGNYFGVLRSKGGKKSSVRLHLFLNTSQKSTLRNMTMESTIPVGCLGDTQALCLGAALQTVFQ